MIARALYTCKCLPLWRQGPERERNRVSVRSFVCWFVHLFFHLPNDNVNDLTTSPHCLKFVNNNQKLLRIYINLNKNSTEFTAFRNIFFYFAVHTLTSSWSLSIAVVQ